VTYYGWRVRFEFTFACGCSTGHGPIHEKFAYQYAGLGAPQTCRAHGAREVERVVEKIDGPHGEYTLGWWKRGDGTGIVLNWEPGTGSVFHGETTGGLYPARGQWQRLGRIADRALIWQLVGGTSLGGDRPEPADEILARFQAAVQERDG
jgi:hypothetical protein